MTAPLSFDTIRAHWLEFTLPQDSSSDAYQIRTARGWTTVAADVVHALDARLPVTMRYLDNTNTAVEACYLLKRTIDWWEGKLLVLPGILRDDHLFFGDICAVHQTLAHVWKTTSLVLEGALDTTAGCPVLVRYVNMDLDLSVHWLEQIYPGCQQRMGTADALALTDLDRLDYVFTEPVIAAGQVMIALPDGMDVLTAF